MSSRLRQFVFITLILYLIYLTIYVLFIVFYGPIVTICKGFPFWVDFVNSLWGLTYLSFPLLLISIIWFIRSWKTFNQLENKDKLPIISLLIAIFGILVVIFSLWSSYPPPYSFECPNGYSIIF